MQTPAPAAHVSHSWPCWAAVGTAHAVERVAMSPAAPLASVVPDAHTALQPVRSCRHSVPDGHGRHAADVFAPRRPLYLPSGQSRHTDAPSPGAYLPAAQGWQAESKPNEPALHAAQPLSPSRPNPAGQDGDTQLSEDVRPVDVVTVPIGQATHVALETAPVAGE